MRKRKSNKKTDIWRAEVSNPKSHNHNSGKADIKSQTKKQNKHTKKPQTDSLFIALSLSHDLTSYDILRFKTLCKICKPKAIIESYSINNTLLKYFFFFLLSF